MTLKETLSELEALSDEKRRAHNAKNGAHDNQFGVKMGDIRKMAKKIKSNHDLALALWTTENIDARFLAVLIIKTKALSADEVDEMVKSLKFIYVADWLNNYVIKKHPEKEALRQKWMTSKNSMAARAGWNLTAERVAKSPKGLDLTAILNRIESEMETAPSETQWAMNNTLVAIGIHFSDYREQALAIGHALGIYRDYPTSKGCTSPFAPIWINEMVKRQA